MKNKSASRLQYDFGKLFTAAKTFIDTHNKKSTNLKDRLNANHRATAELIVRLYAKQLNKLISSGNPMHHEFPGFKTFNPSLASCKGCTTRTIMNHKERLKSAGFIIKETHHGKTGIELWINPLIFTPKKLPTPTVCKETKISQITSFFTKRVKNFHPLVHVQQEQNNNNSSVDILITSEKQGVRPKAHKQKYNCVTRTAHEQHMNTRESRTSDSDKQTRRLKNSSTGESESAFLLNLVQDFWLYTQPKLFESAIFSKPEETEILNFIWSSVYRKFKIKGSTNEWKSYQETLYARVDMVKRWLVRNPCRWIPPAHLYFHPENKRNSFIKTYRWFIKQQALKRQIRNRILIQKAEQEWKDYNQGEGKNRHKTRLQLFRLQQQHLDSYGDPMLIRAYEKSLQKIVNT